MERSQLVLAYQGCHDGPQVVAGPAKSNNDEELPLIPPHANFLDLPWF